jgi:hypothetical protein
VWHPILSSASRETQRAEIALNLLALKEDRSPSPRVRVSEQAARKDYNADTIEVLRECDVDVAFTTGERFATVEVPALEVPRFLIRATTGDAELAHRLAYSWKR